MSALICGKDVCETRGFFSEGSFCGYERVQVVRGEVVVLLNRFESPFHSEPSHIHYLVCGCSSVNALSSHITPHLYGQAGVIHKLV